MVLMAMGLLFQMPIGILAVTRVGIVSARQLRKNRRYAILVIAVIAMVLPGQDPVTMLDDDAPMRCSSRGLSCGRPCWIGVPAAPRPTTRIRRSGRLRSPEPEHVTRDQD